MVEPDHSQQMDHKKQYAWLANRQVSVLALYYSMKADVTVRRRMFIMFKFSSWCILTSLMNPETRVPHCEANSTKYIVFAVYIHGTVSTLNMHCCKIPRQN